MINRPHNYIPDEIFNAYVVSVRENVKKGLSISESCTLSGVCYATFRTRISRKERMEIRQLRSEHRKVLKDNNVMIALVIETYVSNPDMPCKAIAYMLSTTEYIVNRAINLYFGASKFVETETITLQSKINDKNIQK